MARISTLTALAVSFYARLVGRDSTNANHIYSTKESIVSEAYYTRRLRETGNQVEFHFFKPEVLAHYREHPDYDVCSSHLYGNGSMIQNIFWGRTKQNVPCLAVLLAHLSGLSPADQTQWKCFELADSELAKVDARYRSQIIDGDWPSRIDSFEAIFLFAREINSLFSGEGESMFRNCPNSNVSPDFLMPLAHNAERSLVRFAQDLDTFLQPNPKLLVSRIATEDRKGEAEIARSKGQTRNLLRLYFEDRGVMTAAISEGLESFKRLSTLRQQSAHTLVAAEGGKDYREVQSTLAFDVQAALKAMLEGTVLSENAPEDGYRSFVLRLEVE